jgi:Photosynthesis system II assembly factor YCF48/Putative zinc-finger
MEQLPKIVQRRLPGTPKSGAHPDPDLLTAFVEKSLSDGERSQVLQHLAECADCRDVMSLALPETESSASPGAERSRWLSWPVLRWGALAACIVVVSAAITLRHDRRSTNQPSFAEKVPAASGASALPSNVAKAPGEELAAKIAPRSALQTAHDFAASGKLAKQRETKMDAGTVAARTVVIAPRVPDQEAKDQALANIRSSNAVALVPGPTAPLPTAKLATAEPQTDVRNDAADHSARTAAEMATLGGASAATPEMGKSAEQKAKDKSAKKELQQEVQAPRASAAGAMALGGRKADTLAIAPAQTSSDDSARRSQASHTAARWTLSADGAVQRSFDSGKTWQTVQVASNIVFRALAANDSDIWVGGAAGALYHSSDAGQHWLQVNPVANGAPLTADIVSVEFSDAQHGKLTTSSRETWTTSDAGDTWQSH